VKLPFDTADPGYHIRTLVILSAVVVTVMFTEAMLTPALPLIQDEFGISGVWTALTSRPSSASGRSSPRSSESAAISSERSG